MKPCKAQIRKGKMKVAFGDNTQKSGRNNELEGEMSLQSNCVYNGKEILHISSVQ